MSPLNSSKRAKSQEQRISTSTKMKEIPRFYDPKPDFDSWPNEYV